MKRIALYVLLGAIGVAALAAMIVLLGNESWRYLELQVLGTAGLVALGSILTMVCGACWETGRAPTLALVGLGGSLIGTGFFTLATWIDISSSDFFGLAWTAMIAGVACTHACLLTLANVAKSYRAVLPVSFIAILTLAAQLIALWWIKDYSLNDQLVGINVVIVAACSLAVPILHKLNPIEAPHGHVMCPNCGQASQGPLGRQQCPTCSTRYQVSLVR